MIDDAVFDLAPGDLAIYDPSLTPGLDDEHVQPCVIVWHDGDLNMLMRNGTFDRIPPHAMARNADWYP